jgi:hypothetical protein
VGEVARAGGPPSNFFRDARTGFVYDIDRFERAENEAESSTDSAPESEAAPSSGSDEEALFAYGAVRGRTRTLAQMGVGATRCSDIRLAYKREPTPRDDAVRGDGWNADAFERFGVGERGPPDGGRWPGRAFGRGDAVGGAGAAPAPTPKRQRSGKSKAGRSRASAAKPRATPRATDKKRRAPLNEDSFFHVPEAKRKQKAARASLGRKERAARRKASQLAALAAQEAAEAEAMDESS